MGSDIRRGAAAAVSGGGGGGGTSVERDRLTLLRSLSRDGVGGDVILVKADGSPTADAVDNDGGGDDGQAAKFVGPAIPPDSVSPYTTSSQLLYQWCAAKASNEEMPDKVIVDVYMPHRAPLKGRELLAFLAEEEREVCLRKA